MASDPAEESGTGSGEVPSYPAALSDPQSQLEPFGWYREMRWQSPVRYDERRRSWDVFRYETVDSILREHLRGFEEAGVDQVIFIQQGGNNEHEHICESLELFAEDVMCEFHDRHAGHEREKRERLEPAIEAAMERKEPMEPATEEEIPKVVPFDRDVSDYE